MSEVYLCNRGRCCPYIIEDIKNNRLKIVEGDTEIVLEEEYIENLRKYLNNRHK